MADVNTVVLAGRLTRDAELKYTASGVAIVKLAVAVNSRKKDANGEWVDEANFIDVTLFGKQGEAINSYLIKGKQVAVEGALRQDRWEQEGQNRSRVYVMANNVMLLGGGDRAGGSGASSPSSRERDDDRDEVPISAPPAAKPKRRPASDDFDDDIPF